jgi:DNA gyrase/topoisomerase IV subunit A
MATTKSNKDRRSSAGTVNLAPLKEESLASYVTRAMHVYGSEVNEDRAIPSYQDGLKPVQRRLVWAANSVGKAKVKSALVVAECMGKYHPHGDSSIYGALVNMVNSNVPLMTGLGNWGSLLDPAAAMRYTNTMLATFGSEFLKREYLAVTPRVPNYDSTLQEPLYLPALLPNIFMNPSSGIGVGVKTGIPAYTPESLLKMTVRLLDKEELTPADWAKGLAFYEPWGGELTKSKANFAALKEFYTTGNGSIEFFAPLTFDESTKRIRMQYFVPGVRIDSSDKKRNDKGASKESADTGLGLIDRIRKIPQVKDVYTDGGISQIIQLNSSVNMNECRAVLAKIQKMVTAKRSYNVFTTERVPEADEKYSVKFFNCSVPDVLVMWLKFRVRLEVRSLKWLISELETEIKYTELLIYVCSKLDVLFDILKKRLDKAGLCPEIQKRLKIDEGQAKQVMELRVHQLSKLDQEAQEEKLKQQQQQLKKLQAKLANPVKEIRTYLAGMQDKFKEFNGTNPQQVQWIL